MSTIFTRLESNFDIVIENAGYNLLRDIANFSELSITEASVSNDNLITKINKFISKIIVGFIAFKDGIKNELERRIAIIKTKGTVRSNYNKLVKMKADGVKTVESVDYKALSDIYMSSYKEMRKYSLKFSNITYKHMQELNNDIASFTKLKDETEAKLEKVYAKKVSCNIDKMIKFYEDEITGKKQIFNTINESIDLLNKVQSECTKLIINKEIVGPNILPKHVSFIRKIVMEISRLVKKWVTKIVVGSIVLFA